MKRLPLLLTFFGLLLSLNTFANSLSSIKGKVVDADTQAPLAGATLYISDLKASTSTNNNGEFTFNNVPSKGKFLLEVRYLGYKTSSRLIDLATQQVIIFALETSVIESAEVVITGTPFSANNKTNSLAVVSISRDKLAQSAATNLVSAIAKIPGVAQVTTGEAIAKPTIRGLGYNRVLTMVDGAREEGQQWGDEHGVQVDQFAAARIEVLKGPASLLYGSDALGGVINIIDDLVPAAGTYNGNFTTNYSTNAGLTASSLMMQGNADGFVYRGRVSYKNAYGFGYKGHIVPNAGFNEINSSAMLGLTKTWGYAHLNLSRFATNIGLVEEGPDADGNYLDADGNPISKSNAKKRSLNLPYQNINHYRAALNSNVLLNGGQLKSTLAFQRNIRKEFEETKDEPGLNLGLNSYTYDVKYSFANHGTWQPTIGLQGMYQTNRNSGEEFLVPDYNSNNIGAFAYLKRNFENGAINAGARYDFKKIDGKDLVEEHGNHQHQIFTAFDNSFSNFTGSLGFAYDIAKNLNLKGNIGSGFRAPNIAELGANGVHHGTFRYEIGNSNLKQETSLQFDLGLTYQAENITLGLNAYSNKIYDYIYLSNLNGETINAEEHHSGLMVTYPVYRFLQTDASLVGTEAAIDFHLVKALHFENTFAYVKGTNKATNSPLPFIPAASLTNEIRFEPNLKGLHDSFIKVSLNNVFKQDSIDAFETETDGYTLFDAGIGTSFKTKRGKLNIWVTGQNLTNKLYYNHLSRYKLAHIYNAGRNVSFGVSVPL
ncbi:TonB-dependent receptor [uncultured Pedobacter sp.]|uniref:TonB-dependent receptor n=1 Tax=uncultured Pedobacter sp. TaxID=246139 RepID=UPI0026052ADA|nr:TonB-dependent receptor [uncultured Pedobacter sp.]